MKKTSKLMTAVSSTALALGLVGCSTSGSDDWESSAGQTGDIPPMPENTDCGQWDWDEDDGVWECDDRNSSYFGHLFFAGMFFSNRSALYKNRDFVNYRNSPSFKGKTGTGDSIRNGGSGFGRGSTSTGG
ncbi:aminotransferase yhxA [Bacillus sp. FJAT-18017]|uniref:aminotransferase yhxA n=1 Tax=Bacillus sp. FJAT-18017 TaxID=1705566 RepID=UPI000B2AABB0|nr:aminotransferase yhxA [Bacillus sp. FJAT-18017]